MKLAILVVYYVNNENEELLRIHLDQISCYTNSDFKIYASTNLCTLKQKDNLRKNVNIKLCDCPNYIGPMNRDRATYEHSFYLNHLVNYALEDEMTHFVVLHPDSFPIKMKWELILSKYLTENVMMATLKYSPTSCLFFTSKFVKNFQVSFGPPKHPINDKKFMAFLKNNDLIIESGIGYKYSAFLNGFNWRELERTNNGNDHYHFGSIYGDLIFHLGAAEHKDRSFPEQKEYNLFYYFKNIFSRFLPNVAKNWMHKLLKLDTLSLGSNLREQGFRRVRELLYSDPTNYIDYLRKGGKKIS